MKIFLRIVSGLLLSLALILGAGAVFLLTTYPRVPAASVSRIQPTPEKVKRGHYLANYVAVCVDCHSTRDWNQFAGPIVPGTDGKGGEQFDESMGLPGKLFAKNITPSHLATWSDGEIIRAFTSGLSRDGRALFPLMPYPNYSLMSQEDAEAIVAYLRTLKPIENTPPETHLDFPVSLLVRTMPQAAPFSRRPSPQEGLVYGKYMTQVASCRECHTAFERGKFVGEEFAGGREFPMPGVGLLRTPNLTPDPETGIGSWTRQTFVARFKAFKTRPIKPGEFNTIMPWGMYAGMTEEDLGAIFDYLHSLKPVRHLIERFVSLR